MKIVLDIPLGWGKVSLLMNKTTDLHSSATYENLLQQEARLKRAIANLESALAPEAIVWSIGLRNDLALVQAKKKALEDSAK